MPTTTVLISALPESPVLCWAKARADGSVTEPLCPPAPTSSISKPCTAVPLSMAAVGAEKRSVVPQTDASPGASVACMVAPAVQTMAGQRRVN